MFGFIPQQLEIDDEDDDDLPPATWPEAGSALIEIKQVENALFFSAEWKIVVFVNGNPLYESEVTGTPQTQGVVDMWSRHCLRKKYNHLRARGVDVDTLYTTLGGNKNDLD